MDGHASERRRPLSAAVIVGLVWAQVAIAVHVLVLPRYLPLGLSIAYGGWFRAASWTLLAPLSLASWLTRAGQSQGASAPTIDLPLPTLVLSPLLAVMLCVLAALSLGRQRWRAATAGVLALAGLIGATSGVAVAMQFTAAASADGAFFALLSGVEVAHKDAAAVAGARDFVRRYPDSRWTGEALRIVAMAEWDAGRIEAAAQQWTRFAARFRDRSAPGVAYAEYNLALCDERLGRWADARGHLREAISAIRLRGDGTQAWIARDAARRLEVLERLAGRHALAGYWNTKSRTFANVYPTD